MPKRSDGKNNPDRDQTRDKLIGLGKSSIRKSYYPELRNRVRELERFRALLDHSSDAVFMANADTGQLFDSNATAAHMLGCEPADLEGITIADIFPLRPAERIMKYLRSPGAEQSVFFVSTEARLQDGPTIPVEVSVKAVSFADESYGVLSARDISERLHAEKALRQSEDKYRSIFENAMEGIFQTTPDGALISANQSLAEIMAYDSLEQMFEHVGNIGEQFYESTLDRKRLIKLLQTRNEIKDFETRFRRNDGELIWVSINVRAIRDPQGNIDHLEGSFLDISARKKLEEREQNIKDQLRRAVRERTHALLAKTRELKEANTRLMELDEMKSAFLSSVSHELRTPLTSILGFAKLINRDFTTSFLPGAQNDEARRTRGDRILENLGIIQNEGERLTRLINDFLDLSKIESGRLEWRDQVIRPSDIMQDVFEAVRGQFAGKPAVDFSMNVEGELPVLRVDPDRIKQVLLNLLSNAYKFTNQGHVRLEAAAEKDLAALLFRVSDTGPGIGAEDRERIFDKFQQAHHQDTLLDKPRGTGLGLSICKQIVRHYGGNIWVEDALDKSGDRSGSMFVVRLPTACTCEDPVLEEEMANFVEDRPVVLIVDDDPAIISFLSQTMTMHGFNVSVASCGENALYKARKLRPSLITMDLLMPGMDGRDAITALRRERDTRNIPILVISVMPEAHRAGGDAALIKPVGEMRLLDAVFGLLNSKHPSEPMLALKENGSAHLGPYFALCEGCIIHCTEDELWTQIEAGFTGTVIVPQSLAVSDVVTRLHKTPAINVLLLPAQD